MSELKSIFSSLYLSELLPVKLCFKAVKGIVRSFTVLEKLEYSSEEGARVILKALGIIGSRYIIQFTIENLNK